MSSVGLHVCPTLFTVAVAPVHSASGVPKKAPGSDPAIRVATLVVFSQPFAWVALPKAGHTGPVHALVARLGYVYRPAVETVLSEALDAGRERRGWCADAAGVTEVAARSQKRSHEREKEQIINHVGSYAAKIAVFNHQLRRSSSSWRRSSPSCGRTEGRERKSDADQSKS